MKKVILSLVVCASLMGLQGCSIGKALSGPPPIEFEKVKVGESRSTFMSVLGAPKTSEITTDSKTDMFEFIDGYSGASKTRVIIYIAGDVFTAGLAELLFWPIELVADGGTKGRAIVKYGLDDIAKSVLLTQLDGKPWGYIEPIPVPRKTVSRVDPVTGNIIVD